MCTSRVESKYGGGLLYAKICQSVVYFSIIHPSFFNNGFYVNICPWTNPGELGWCMIQKFGGKEVFQNTVFTLVKKNSNYNDYLGIRYDNYEIFFNSKIYTMNDWFQILKKWVMTNVLVGCHKSLGLKNIQWNTLYWM